MPSDPQYQFSESTGSQMVKALRRGRKILMWTGILMAVAGLLAVLFPMVSTLAVEFWIGAMLLFAGIVTLLGSFSMQGTGSFFGSAVWGLLSIAAGAFLLFDPAGAAVVLTLLIAVLFLLHGAFEATLALALRPAHGWGWMMLSAIFATAVGFLVIAGVAEASPVLLGLLVGVNFLSTGIALIVLARRLEPMA